MTHFESMPEHSRMRDVLVRFPEKDAVLMGLGVVSCASERPLHRARSAPFVSLAIRHWWSPRPT